MADINSTLSIIILNVNRLNTPIKRERWGKWVKKYKKKPRSNYMLLTKDTHFRFKDTNRMKVNGWEKTT